MQHPSCQESRTKTWRQRVLNGSIDKKTETCSSYWTLSSSFVYKYPLNVMSFCFKYCISCFYGSMGQWSYLGQSACYPWQPVSAVPVHHWPWWMAQSAISPSDGRSSSPHVFEHRKAADRPLSGFIRISLLCQRKWNKWKSPSGYTSNTMSGLWDAR